MLACDVNAKFMGNGFEQRLRAFLIGTSGECSGMEHDKKYGGAVSMDSQIFYK